jgi:hypothetical protein
MKTSSNTDGSGILRNLRSPGMMRHAGSILNEIVWFKCYDTYGLNVLPKIRVQGFVAKMTMESKESTESMVSKVSMGSKVSTMSMETKATNVTTFHFLLHSRLLNKSIDNISYSFIILWHDIAEILLKLVLSINQSTNQSLFYGTYIQNMIPLDSASNTSCHE